jgi:hypothetical protein
LKKSIEEDDNFEETKTGGYEPVQSSPPTTKRTIGTKLKQK